MNGESGSHVEDLYQALTNAILRGKSPDSALAELRRDQARLFGRYPEVLDERLLALEEAHLLILEQQNHVKYLERRALRFGREQWYLGPANEGSLWGSLRERLHARGRSAEEIDIVDIDSSIVVGLLDSPSKQRFSTRGLVVGHVQSGKTGNIAAVINKAADTPYKFFLVLSGLTDQLRNQTQIRLEADVIGLAPSRWMTWTTTDTEQARGEFSERAIGGFSFDHRNQIAVIKKNSGVLRRFLAKLKNTDEATLMNTPFLIIDDECDQASVNSARYATAITRINELIRAILGKLPKAAYVGYTATPFANVLIDTTETDDLYPRHFIHALRRPSAYFGAQELFGRHALEGEYDESGEAFDMIRTVPDGEINKLRPPTGRNGRVENTPSLQQAIRYFVMVVAARRFRNQGEKHNTMLVHTSVLNSIHDKTEGVVKPFVLDIATKLEQDDRALLEQLEREWSKEQGKVLSEQFDQSPVAFSQLLPHLPGAAASVRVHVENWTAVDRLTYLGGPRTYLVIGGNVLARGLTLEGLSVSYFLRSSSQYDTLMQMGRWFGYREGFEDLPRVWVEERVRDAFFDLATVEAEIRRDIARYAEEELTPAEFGVRIRKIPGMAITAPTKMRSARPVAIGYAGTHVQTFRFKRGDLSWLSHNWDAGARLIDAIADKKSDGQVFRHVPAGLVATFLVEYQAHETHKNLAPAFLAAFVRQNAPSDPRLKYWSVVVVGAEGSPSARPLGSLGQVPTVIRSAEADSGVDASIKALMSRVDVLADLEDRGGLTESATWDDIKRHRELHRAAALLLLYPIQAESRPARVTRPDGTVSREPLNAKHDVLGFGIVFPGDKQLSGVYVSANLAPESAEPADELEEGDKIPEALLDDSPGAGGGT